MLHTATTPTIFVASKACFPRKPDLMEISSLISLRYTDFIQLIYLIRHLYLIGAWLGEDHRPNTIKTRVEKRLHYVFKFY